MRTVLVAWLILDLLGLIHVRCSPFFKSVKEEKEAEEEEESSSGKTPFNRARLWNHLEEDVRRGKLEDFKASLTSYRLSGLLVDSDSGYFEVLSACVQIGSRREGQRYLKALLRTICTKNILHWLPDLIFDMELDDFLLVRKYCPVGDHEIFEFLSMFPDLQRSNPLTRYLLENWNIPSALDYVDEELQIDHLTYLNSKGLQVENFAPYPRQFEHFTVADNYVRLVYHNAILIAEEMDMDDIADVLPDLMRIPKLRSGALRKRLLKDARYRLRNSKGNLLLSLLIEGNLHIFRMGLPTCIVVNRDKEEEVEEIVYPLNVDFKAAGKKLTYSVVPAQLDTTILYCSTDLVKSVNMHDILGILLYNTENREHLRVAIEVYFKHLRKIEGNGDIVFDVFQAAKNRNRIRREERHSSLRSSRLFERTSQEETVESVPLEIYSRRTRTIADSLLDMAEETQPKTEPESSSLFNFEGLTLSAGSESCEGSFDDNEWLEEASSGEETIFHRRFWLSAELSGFDSQEGPLNRHPYAKDEGEE